MRRGAGRPVPSGPRAPRAAARAALLIAAALAALPRPAGAALWNPDQVRISTSPQISVTTSAGPCLAVRPDGSAYAVWYQRTGMRSSIVCGAARSADGVWSPPESLTLGDSLSADPTVAAGPQGDIHVVWDDSRHGSGEEIYYRHRDANGAWGPEERVTFSDYSSIDPVIGTAADGRVHVVWSDAASGNFEIYHAWRDPGGPWSSPQRLTTNSGYSRSPTIAVEPGGQVHVVWQDNVFNPRPGDEGNTEIYHLLLAADGTPISDYDRVSDWIGTSRNPCAALGPDGALHVFWSDNRDMAPNGSYFPFAIWYRRWLPGLGFGHEKRFAYSGSDHLFPCASVAPDGTVNVAWEDYAYGNAEIFFRQIHPATGWDVMTRMTQTVGPTRNPSVVADADGNLHLLWSDTTSGQELSIRYLSGRVDATTAVLVTRFSAAWAGELLLVSWDATADAQESGFLIQAAGDLDDEPETLTLAPIATGGRYEVAIAPARLVGRRYLKLVAVARDGNLGTLAVIDVPEENARAGSRPPAVHPNPSRGTFTVAVTLERPVRVGLALVDLAGRRVASLDAGELPPGRNSVAWTPLPGGAPPTAGRYWVRITADGQPAGRAVPILITR